MTKNFDKTGDSVKITDLSKLEDRKKRPSIETNKQRTCLLILGMHRSGTSALTRVLSLGGASLPSTLMKATEANETGYWESTKLYEYHKALLEELNSYWNDWRSIDWACVSPDRREEIKDEINHILDQEFQNSLLFLVKDPRICRFTPLFSEALQSANVDLKIVLPFRNPLEVCRSLESQYQMSHSDAALLWLRHVLDAEAASRHLTRVIVSYENLLGDWKSTYLRISENLELKSVLAIEKIEPDVEEFLSPQYRHHSYSSKKIALDPVMGDWIIKTYESLLILSKDPSSQQALSQLDIISSEFNRATPLMCGLVRDLREHKDVEINALKNNKEKMIQDAKKFESDSGIAASGYLEALKKLTKEKESLSAKNEESQVFNETLMRDLQYAKQENSGLKANQAESMKSIESLSSALKRIELMSGDLKRNLKKTLRKKEILKKRVLKRKAQVSELKLKLVSRDLENRDSEVKVAMHKRNIEGLEKLLRSNNNLIEYGEAIKGLKNEFELLREAVSPSKNTATKAIKGSGFAAISNFSSKGILSSIKRLYGNSSGDLKYFIKSSVFYARDYMTIARSGMFDPSWYLNQNPDVLAANANPIIHYLRYGASEGRNPSDEFISDWYSNYHRDVLKAGVNPLVHFVRYGKKEGRLKFPENGHHFNSGAVEPIVEKSNGSRLVEAHPSSISKDKMSAYVEQVFKNSTPSKGLPLDYVKDIQEVTDYSLSPVKIIAFYLPQFHPIPENNEWWGKGFTEWTNVTKAIPQFVGHHQPRLPDELGFYDLRLEDIQRQQIELARRYGVAGFCYHHYWFAGKRLLETPFNQILANPELDLPFCLCWANENWTRRWDGLENDILMEQNHSPEDDIAFIKDISEALRDPRYIRFNGKPVLLVYRVTLLPDPQATARRWREYCINAGIGDLYLVVARSFGIKDPRPFGFDAAIEFPPHEAVSPCLNDQMEIINPSYRGKIYDYNDMAHSYINNPSTDYTLIKTVCPSWDNEARKPGCGNTFHGGTPSNYAIWLRSACEQNLAEQRDRPEHPPFVFINAWNEWAEGAHLEPDSKYGYAYLHTTANILRDVTPSYGESQKLVLAQQEKFKKKSDTALVIHLHYEQLFDEMLKYIDSAPDVDVFITLKTDISPDDCKKIISKYPNCYLGIYKNRGRDIQPFLQIIRILRTMGYEFACKIHTKKSPQRTDGSELRQNAWNQLLGSKEIVKNIRQRLVGQSNLGMIAPSGSILSLQVPDYNVMNRKWLDHLFHEINRGDMVNNYSCDFVAGSMYWFRVSAMHLIDNLNLSAEDFEEELGQLDGTLAHGIERLMAVSVSTQGFSIEETSTITANK